MMMMVLVLVVMLCLGPRDLSCSLCMVTCHQLQQSQCSNNTDVFEHFRHHIYDHHRHLNRFARAVFPPKVQGGSEDNLQES